MYEVWGLEYFVDFSIHVRLNKIIATLKSVVLTDYTLLIR